MKRLLLIAMLLLPLGKAEASFSLSVVEPDHNFFSGEEIERTLLIGNDTLETKQLVLRWETLVPPAVIQQGEEKIVLEELQSKALQLTLKMPGVKRRATLVWKVQLLCDEKLEVEKRFNYSIFPGGIPVNIKNILAGKKLGLLDSSGKAGEILEDLKVPLTRLSSQLSLDSFEGDLVIIGPEEDPNELLNALLAFEDRVTQGLSVVCFQQRMDIDNFLIPLINLSPQPLELRKPSIVSPGHPVFTGLNENDLSNWREDGVVSHFSIMKPVKGNFRILTEGDLSTALLLEVASGRGRFIFCQLMVIDKFHPEPVAQALFVNLLRYALTEQRPLQPVAIYGDPETEIMKILGSLNVATIDKSTIIIICVSEESRGFIKEHQPQISSHIKGLIQSGGRVLIFATFPEAIDLLGIKWKMEDMEIVPLEPRARGHRDEGIFVLDRESSLFWGMSEDEIQLLTGSGRMVKFALGNAEVIVCQSLFNKDDLVSLSVLCQLLTNLGVKIEGGDE